MVAQPAVLALPQHGTRPPRIPWRRRRWSCAS